MAVMKGDTYRLRLLNITRQLDYVFFFIDEPTMIVIETDGFSHEPKVAEPD
jgi:FtsP/CotA-like multicopper oxidase with cupredoxin domain